MRALPIAALLILSACANNGGLPQAGGPPSAAVSAARGDPSQLALQIDGAILARDPHNIAALLSRGDAQALLQQPDRAAESYTDALRVDPHSVLARIGLGRLRLADDPRAAEALFLEASQDDPRNAVAWNDLGIARDLLGRHQEAQTAYRQALGLDASMHGAEVNLALSLAMTGRGDDAAPLPRTRADVPTEPLATTAPTQALAAAAPVPVVAQVAAATAPTQIAAAVAPALSTADTAPATPAVTPPQIVLTATADAWMQVRDRSGHVLLSRTLHPGDTWQVPAQPNLVLTTGNAGGTDILLDGAATASLGRSGAVRRDIPLDVGFLMAGKPLSTSRQMAAASTGSPATPTHTAPAPPPYSAAVPAASAPIRLASIQPAPIPSATTAMAASLAPTSLTDTIVSPKPVASAPPTQRATTALPATRSQSEANAAAGAVPPIDREHLAAAVAPGMRALTVGVDGVTGTTGLIWPGDRVDLILTQATPADGVPPGPAVAAAMVLSKVRVIAIDQPLGQGTMAEATAPGMSQKPPRAVTFEVDRDQAERVAVATRLGRLWLAARSADTVSQAVGVHPAPATVWASESVAIPKHDATADASHVVHVFPGAADSKEFHF